MKRFRRLGVLALAGLWAGSALASSPESSESQTRYVDVGGHKLRLEVAGSGSPTVVFESGLGDGLAPWRTVFPAVSSFTRAVAYDRAGYGKSDPGPEPRSCLQVAGELHTMLVRAHLPPPYVLAGHSLGAAFVRAFAQLFKDEVAGIVFVDPFSEDMVAGASEKEREEDWKQQDAAVREGPVGRRSEWAFAKGESARDFPELRAFGPPPDVPMALLVAGRDRPRGWKKALLTQYGSWLADASEGNLIVSADSGHYIHTDDPQLVISAVRRVVFPSMQNALARVIKERGVAAAIARYHEMRTRYPAELVKERTLNALGYQQLQAGRVDDALALFKLNVEMYPDSSNTYDSLGEACMAKGDRPAAIANYRRSLALDPDNNNAVRMLKELEKPKD